MAGVENIANAISVVDVGGSPPRVIIARNLFPKGKGPSLVVNYCAILDLFSYHLQMLHFVNIHACIHQHTCKHTTNNLRQTDTGNNQQQNKPSGYPHMHPLTHMQTYEQQTKTDGHREKSTKSQTVWDRNLGVAAKPA